MAIYMQFGDIKGDVTNPSYLHWIELESVQFGDRTVVGPDGSGAERALSIHEIAAMKYQDSASQALYRQSIDGQGVPAIIVFVTSDEDMERERMKLELQDTFISSFSMASQTGDRRAMERLSLNFAGSKVTFR